MRRASRGRRQAARRGRLTGRRRAARRGVAESIALFADAVLGRTGRSPTNVIPKELCSEGSREGATHVPAPRSLAAEPRRDDAGAGPNARTRRVDYIKTRRATSARGRIHPLTRAFHFGYASITF